MIHDAKIAEPPTNGLKSNAAVIVASAGQPKTRRRPQDAAR